MTKNRKTALSSQKVYLRHPAETDFDELYERYRESREHLRDFAPWKYDREDFDHMLEVAARDASEFFLICRLQDDAIVGLINFSQIFRRAFQNAYLGYQLFVGFVGKGYMTEAVAIGLRFAFNELKLHRVEANVQPHNAASIAILKHHGFVKEGYSRRYLKMGGRWRDHERWAIIKEDWKPLKRNVRTARKK